MSDNLFFIFKVANLSHEIADQARYGRDLVKQLIKATGTICLSYGLRRFPKQGYTILAQLATSHIAIHSWPEDGYIEGTLHTCTEVHDQSTLLWALREIFPGGDISARIFRSSDLAALPNLQAHAHSESAAALEASP